MGKMAFRVRSSRFRHVFGSANKKEQCYECIKITKNAHDSNFCAVNPKFLAVVVDTAGGGSFIVVSLDQVGRADINAPKVCGHSGPVLDIKWNPFNDHIIASSSDDATIKLWQIPEGGLSSNLTEWLVDLHGHTRRVAYIEWHPTAENILLSAGYDFNCILWNTETAEPINIISVHSDTIFSLAWNRDGSLFATTSKDKMIRVIDPRSGNVVSEGQGHQGSKASKVVFIGKNNRLFSTGFSKMSDREFAVWNHKNLKKALRVESIDCSSGVMALYYDHDTSIVYIAGKGDGNIRYFEVVEDSPYVHYLSQYQSGSPQRGLGFMPKRGIEPSKCEIFRFYKLHAAKNLCEPVSMIVPRKSEMFQDDLYPPTASSCPSLTADEWIAGQNREPILISLKDGALSAAPTITTYKAVKRSASTPSTAAPNQPASKRPQGNNSPAHSPQTPEHVPSSVRNIAKLSSHTDVSTVRERRGSSEPPDDVDGDAGGSKENNNNPAHGDGVAVSDRIGMFENKNNVTPRHQSLRSATVTSSTSTSSSSNSTVHVNKKLWEPSFTTMMSDENGGQQTRNNDTSEASSPQHPATPQTLSSPSILSSSSAHPPHSPNTPSTIPHAEVTANDYVPYFSKFDRSKYKQQQQHHHHPRSVSDLGLSGGGSAASSILQQQQQSHSNNSSKEHNHNHRSSRSKTSTISGISSEVSEETPTSSPFSTIKRVSVTPPSTLAWNSNPLFDGSSSRHHEEKVSRTSLTTTTTHTSRQELKFNNSGEVTTPLSPSVPLTVDTTQLDQLLTEIDNVVPVSESNYVYKKEAKQQLSPGGKSPAAAKRPQDFGTPASRFSRTISVDSPEPSTPGYSDSNNNPDWIMEDEPAPDDTVIKPSKMRESLRRKSKESPLGSNTDIQRGGFGRSSAREMSASPRLVKKNNNPERMSLRETRSWRSAEPERREDATKSVQSSSSHNKQSSSTTTTTTSSNGYQFIIQSQQQQQQNPPQHPSPQKTKHRRHTVATARKLNEPPQSSDDDSNSMEPNNNNNYKSTTTVSLSGGPPNEYPTLYDNYPRHKQKTPPSSSSSPSKLKESLRKGSARRNTTDATGDYDNNQRVHVKKVWQSPGGARGTGAALSSPTTENGHHANMPTTDPELRKAYFRQLEEISSLREHINVKDKRIRQLEDELKMLRVLGNTGAVTAGTGEHNESTC